MGDRNRARVIIEVGGGGSKSSSEELDRQLQGLLHVQAQPHPTVCRRKPALWSGRPRPHGCRPLNLMRFLFRAAGDGAWLQMPRRASALTRKGAWARAGAQAAERAVQEGNQTKPSCCSNQALGIEGTAVAEGPCRALGRRVWGWPAGRRLRLPLWLHDLGKVASFLSGPQFSHFPP